jgi:hypothetical protein
MVFQDGYELLIEHHATPVSTLPLLYYRPFQAFHQCSYSVGLANNKIVTAAFCGNYLDDLDGLGGLFKVRRPNLETAPRRKEKAHMERFWLRQGVLVGQGPN